uniref:glutathione transferase n=1 Tax=Ditylenchus dipsaci TaxID=166011 RepID=A0A915CXE7_9BILA
MSLILTSTVTSNSQISRLKHQDSKLQDNIELLLNYLNDAATPGNADESRSPHKPSASKASHLKFNKHRPVALNDDHQNDEESMEAVVVVPPFPKRSPTTKTPINMTKVRWLRSTEEQGLKGGSEEESSETPKPVQIPLVGVGSVREVEVVSEEGRPRQPFLTRRPLRPLEVGPEEKSGMKHSKTTAKPLKGVKFSKLSKPSGGGDSPSGAAGSEMNSMKKTSAGGGSVSGGITSGVIPSKQSKQKGTKTQSNSGPQPPQSQSGGPGKGNKGPSPPPSPPKAPMPPSIPQPVASTCTSTCSAGTTYAHSTPAPMPAAPMPAPPPPPPSMPAPTLPPPTTLALTTTTTKPPKQNYKLIYFDARGICEPIRLLFHYAKTEFEDARITRKQWLALKDSTIYGKVPILEVNGKPLTYCHTISRFLARTFGKLKVSINDVAMDLQPFLYVVAGFHQGDKEGLRKAVFLPGVEKHFPVYVNILKQSGSGFFIPSGLTWIDFVIAEYMTTIKHFEPAILDKYPAITKFVRKVQSLPQIFEYIANREHQPV